MNVGFITTNLIAGSSSRLIGQDAKEGAQATRASQSVFSDIIQDRITISSSSADNFSVTTPVEDYLPQGNHISTKKKFKSLKEYTAYLMLLFRKMDKIKTTPGSNFVKIEDRSEFTKLKNELKDVMRSDVIS